MSRMASKNCHGKPLCHAPRSILDGYFNPLVFWYQWDYLLTSKDFFFCRVSKIGNGTYSCWWFQDVSRMFDLSPTRLFWSIAHWYLHVGSICMMCPLYCHCPMIYSLYSHYGSIILILFALLTIISTFQLLHTTITMFRFISLYTKTTYVCTWVIVLGELLKYSQTCY